MKNGIKIISAVIIITTLIGVRSFYSKRQKVKNIVPVNTGILQGRVTIGPVCTKEIIQRFPTYSCKPTPEMYAAAHVLIYMSDEKTFVQTIIPDEKGNFSASLPEGSYFIDMIHQRMGGTKGVPVTVTITKDKPVTLSLDVDTGLR